MTDQSITSKGYLIYPSDVAAAPLLALSNGEVILIVALLYYSTPNVQQPKFRWMSWGAVLAILVWILASIGFGFYVANFSSYSATYGSVAGVIVFLLWLWITNVAILLGAELNAEHERSRELKEGAPGAERELQLEPRSEPKDSKRARTA